MEYRTMEYPMPTTMAEIVEYLRTAACVHPETGARRMPTRMDDDVFDAAASLLEILTAAAKARAA